MGRTPQERYWFTQEFLDNLESEDDEGAFLQLWLFLGGPEGSILDPT